MDLKASKKTETDETTAIMCLCRYLLRRVTWDRHVILVTDKPFTIIPLHASVCCADMFSWKHTLYGCSSVHSDKPTCSGITTLCIKTRYQHDYHIPVIIRKLYMVSEGGHNALLQEFGSQSINVRPVDDYSSLGSVHWLSVRDLTLLAGCREGQSGKSCSTSLKVPFRNTWRKKPDWDPRSCGKRPLKRRRKMCTVCALLPPKS